MDDRQHERNTTDKSESKDEPIDWFSTAEQAREPLRPALANRRNLSVTDIIHEMRERRDAQLLGNLLRSIAEGNGEYVDESGIRGDGIGEKPHWQVLLKFAWDEEAPKWESSSGKESPLEVVTRKMSDEREQQRLAEMEGQRNEDDC